jgi:uncharacterized metal-binding protein YceD (DUF177 family)
MKMLDEFNIEIAKLNLGQHDFSYRIGNKFFELFDYGLVKKGDLKVDLELVKKPSFISLSYKIDGDIELTCDRSLEKFDHHIRTQNKVIVKFGDEARELTEEIEVQPFDIQRMNVAQHIYEFITVAIPMKKLHPRYKDEDKQDQIIYSSASDEEQEDEQMDPRWSALKKLKRK